MTAAFSLRGVTKTFAGPVPFTALHGVNLTIPQGALCTIVGPSGSGKSTLLSLLGLLDRPTTGELQITGHPVATTSEPELCAIRAERLAFVFQAFHLMHHRSVEDNVMLGGLYRGLDRTQRQIEAQDALDRVGLSAKVRSLAATLSGGERQRVAIARALVGSPQILLCDEPTGNLDTKNGQAIVALLAELSSDGMTIVVVTHDASVAQMGNHQIKVIDGKVSGDGCV